MRFQILSLIISLIVSLLNTLTRCLTKHHRIFPGTVRYWEKRYRNGGHSGDGSSGQLAEFKAEVLNGFVKLYNVSSVIEFGCGDGKQLLLAKYPRYLGFDVSKAALSMCRNQFSSDSTKVFKLMREYNGELADLTLSLDVIYHLIEDDIYDKYMCCLFDASKRFVIIYSSNCMNHTSPPHVRHRRFSYWVAQNRPDWDLIEMINNPYPWHGNTKTGSFSDFYIYRHMSEKD